MFLLIACGNSLRQDDGAGLLLAQRLANEWQADGLPVRYLPVQQLVPELALEIAQPEVTQVVFVDTRVAVAETDTAVQITPIIRKPHAPRLGHHLNPELLLLYAQALFEKRPSPSRPFAWQITVPGFAFGHGEKLSQDCQIALAQFPIHSVAEIG